MTEPPSKPNPPVIMTSREPGPLGLTRNRSQRGFGMYVVVMLIGAVATVTVAAVLTARALQTKELVDQAGTLAEAKQALIGWAITRGSTSNPGSSRPGDLPAPDTLTNATPNYNGDQEATCLDATRITGLPGISTGVNLRCLGRLPWRALQMSIKGGEEQDDNTPSQVKMGERDADGRMPWYAVSANLTATDTCLTQLNSALTTRSYPGNHVCADATSLPYPWLTVRDTRGNILSNRVAFVVILPGPVVGSQQRRAAPNLGGASEYLDSMTVVSGCSTPCVAGTYSNADLDNDFIAGDTSDTFNDRLLYVTMDELMAAVENQVASTIAGAVRSFATTYTDSSPNPRYPWLSPFNPAGSSTPDAIVGTTRGMAPTHVVGGAFTTGFTWSMSGSPPVTRSGTVNSSEVRNYTVPAGQGSCVWSSIGMHRVECTATVTNPETGVTRRSVTLRYTGSSTSPIVNSSAAAGNLVVSPATSSTLTTRSINRTTLSSVTIQIIDYDDTSITWSYNPFTGTWVYGAEIVGYGTENAGSGYSIRTSGITMYPVLPTWYVNNDWHRFTYAAIASGYQPGGGNSCAGGCFTVRLNGNSISTTAQVVVLSAGGLLTGQNRSPHNTTLSNYFDSSNNWSALTTTFDRQKPRSTTFNDQIAVISQ